MTFSGLGADDAVEEHNSLSGGKVDADATRPDGRCSECVRGRLPLPETLRDELGALLLAPAIQHLEV